MKIKELALGTLSRILRYAGILLLIYISMVFYLALTERRNAFPRAITHNEAREAIADKARAINCTLDDGTKLEGFVVGNEQNNVILYYPDADEDAAQFLAELDSLPGYAAATFNYRGSGENKGTPSQETFESDAQMIYECATQINGNAPKVVAGRGTGAILATKMVKKENIILTVGNLGTYPKATDNLLKAFAGIAEGNDYKLVLVGSIADEFKPFIASYMKKHPEAVID